MPRLPNHLRRRADTSTPTDCAGSTALELSVLTVLEDFDASGGGSQALVAWELGLAAEELDQLWAKLTEDRLLRPAGTDPVYSEAMFRLTPTGTEELRRRRDAAERS